jgi:hypothetical protein
LSVCRLSFGEVHSLIVATGADSRWLGVEGEWTFRGGGVSSCATCDGFLFRDKAVVVIGGGDTAMEDALVLARTSSRYEPRARNPANTLRVFQGSEIPWSRVRPYSSSLRPFLKNFKNQGVGQRTEKLFYKTRDNFTPRNTLLQRFLSWVSTLFICFQRWALTPPLALGTL